jgi:hypothetical protein
MMRGVLRSLLVVSVLGGIASADPGDPMPSEQTAPAQKADSKFEVVKKDPPAEGAAAKPARAKHKAKHKARKHKKAHRKAAAKKAP